MQGDFRAGETPPGETVAGETTAGNAGVAVAAGAVERISRDITDRANGGAAAWDAVPGFAGAAAGAAFADRGARLAAAVDGLRVSGRGTYRRLDAFSPAVAGQFAALGDVDGRASESINRIGGAR